MLRGLYTAWTGMRTEEKRLDVIANNIANVSTTGYKNEGVVSQSFDQVLAERVKDEPGKRGTFIGDMYLGSLIGEVYTDHTQGAMRATGETYDLAIGGNGFFEMRVTDANGNDHIRYTRAGNFFLNSEGYVVDSNGYHVQSESGDLFIDPDAGSVVFDELGGVYVDGELTDQLHIVDFEDYEYLKKYADTLYEPVQGAKKTDAEFKLVQGYLEASNVNVVSEMVNMIAITRAYEAGQKVIQAYDSSMDMAANSVGKV